MADVIDLETYRKKLAENGESRPPRRRRTPGGRGFGDMSHHLSNATPSDPGTDDNDDEPPQAG
ncbi:MAG: hypothetical protein CMM46_10010 [Rhodospirillaceae bacterium]|nr:hypothetical protein [Rhodospirillaceae bacterium]|tara:strand:+ start:1997 stop:2185 length:189 start_codon:yes stop_codon:yes gene_type:complete